MKQISKSQSGIAPVILVIVIVAVLSIIGVVAFRVMSDGSGGDDMNDPASESAGNAPQSTETFDALPTADLEFEARMSGTTAEGDAYSAVILSDGEGNTKYTSTTDGESVESYILSDGRYITCTDGGCFQFQNTDSQIPTDNYEYSREEFDNFKNTASYQGKESCPAGTCDVWEVADGDGNTTTKVYLASDRRVSKLTASNESGSFEITYEYKDVSVEAPADVQALPNPN